MAYLINRNPCGRIICLHALLRYLYERFNDAPFTLNDMKYDKDASSNIHKSCKLLTKLPSIPFLTCPYLDNPLSNAKCYLTQSIQEDTQKSKSVSDAFNALEGMGFVNRIDRGGVISPEGKEFISHEYKDEETLHIIRNGLLSYGPFIGLINNLVKSNGVINRSDIKFGYPSTNETVTHNGQLIRLSTGSEEDTMTRTRSTLFIWALTGGFIFPEGYPKIKNIKKWHVELLPYIVSTSWGVNSFRSCIEKDFFKNKLYVGRPLTYNSMTKSTKALRERNQDDIRSLTLKFENVVKNRRFAIVYLLANGSKDNITLDINKMAAAFKKRADLFIIDTRHWEAVLSIELSIASLSGIPFNLNANLIEPLTMLSIEELTKDSPPELIKILDEIYNEINK